MSEGQNPGGFAIPQPRLFEAFLTVAGVHLPLAKGRFAQTSFSGRAPQGFPRPE